MKRHVLTSSLLICLFLIVQPRDVRAQFPEIDSALDIVSWTTSVSPETVHPGGEVFVQFDAEMTGDWKMYALDVSLPPKEAVLARPYGVTIEWVDLPLGLSASDVMYQAVPEEGLDPYFDMTVRFFHESVRFASRLLISPEMVAGAVDVEANVQFQVCSDELGFCLRPTTVALGVTVMVDPECLGPACTASESMIASLVIGEYDEDEERAPLLSATTDFEASRASGMWGFLLLAIGAGLASLLTPCVFPMIPLTISYFTKHAENRAEAARMASLFGGAIIVTFTAIGIIAAILVGAAGAQRIAANPWVNLFIAVVLVGFALSLLGLYELRLPSGLLNYFNRKGSERTGYVGVLFMGLTLTLVSFSCTAPFVGGLLAAASGGTWFFPLIGMVVYSATFALPFILLALFPNALNALPHSGSWMNSVKVILGFVELAAAIKFFSNADLIWRWGLISRPFGIAFIVVVFFLTGLYLLGRLRLRHEAPLESIGVGRLLASMVFFVAALYMIPGLLGAPLNKLDAYLPPRQGTDVSILSLIQTSNRSASISTDEGWHVDDVEGAFEEAARDAKPVLVDFTGYTCTNCREMEANVFPRKPIADRFESDYVLLRLYTDGLEHGDEFNRYQLQLTGTVALPTYAIVEPFERRLLARRSGMMDVDEFAAFLDAGAETFKRTFGGRSETTAGI